MTARAKGTKGKVARASSSEPEAPSPRGRFAWAPLVAMLGGAVCAYGTLASCGKPSGPPQPKANGATSSASANGGGTTNAKSVVDTTDDSGMNVLAVPEDALGEPADAGAPSGPLLGAAHFQTHVFEEPNYSSTRIGYLRAGAKVAIRDGVLGEPVKRIRTPSCKEGWVAIMPRGYVCLEKGGGALNLEQPNVRLATAPPNFEELLPYKYGVVFRNGVPLYRKVPSVKEWQEKEPWTKPQPKKPKKAEKSDDDDPYGTTTASAESTAPSESDAGASGGTLSELMDAAVDAEPSTPWWERDAGKESISLRDTMEAEGLVARRMAKGFFISIDRTFQWNNRSWYRTTMGLVAPADAVMLKNAPDFKGVELTGDWQLPIGYPTSGYREIALHDTKDKKSFVSAGTNVKRQQPIKLMATTATGYEEIKVGKYTYVPTVDGHWVRADQIVRIDVAPRPADVKPGEKWIDVSIKNQTLVAYEGDKPVYATLVSTGRDGTDKKGKFATVQGSFSVREKHVAATMDGDTSGELYSIDDVPYIQYFHDAYALHGAFWHADYGKVRSHGCVNLSPADAKRLFFWTEPQLPTGWHAVWATKQNPGTRVFTHP